jgi:hypothetical protein
MTVRYSTGYRNALATGIGFAALFNRGSINIYTGTQPTTADSAATGTLLGTLTLASGALTKETQASGTITVTGGSTSITAVTVGTFNIIPDGAVLYNTSVGQTASDLCDAINRNGYYTATVSDAVVTIKPRPGAGATHNTYVVASTGSVTATYTDMTGGVSAVNGLIFTPAAGGVVNKSGVWSMNGIAAGTAGWFRLVGSVADAGSAIVAAPYLARMDGSCATSGADLNISNILIAIGAPSTCDQFVYTQPAS